MGATRITRVKVDAPDIKTLYFPSIEAAQPGQYVMVWVPGVDEVPMSLSKIIGESAVTVRSVGDATRAISSLEEGDRFGIRGPFGRAYTIEGRRPLLIGGGTGVASLAPLAEAMVSAGIRPTFLQGARSREQLIFRDRLGSLLGNDFVVSTDDGSEGYHGYASNYADDLMRNKEYDRVYVCGPEIMTAKIYESADKLGVPMQTSLERLCKCAIGLCGACAIGPYRVCKDGPVFGEAELKRIKGELGGKRMDASGRWVRVDR